MAASNKVALVTGASSGIGRASAVALLKAGFSVALIGRREEGLAESIAEAGADGARALPIQADVTDPAAISMMFAKTMEKFGRLDVVFNNAGGGTPPVPMEELTLAQWQTTVAVNLTAPFLCTQEAFRIMKDQTPMGGRIINNGSISAHTPRPFSAPYTSTKHAITGLTKATSLDGRKYNIACSQIDIGNAVTPMTERMTGGVLQPNGDMIPEPRMDVQHVADAVVQIATMPLESNVLFMTIMATKMPFVGRA
ncbi:MAG: SDR family oxidoreductase [Alphaproteobacteria bacterium]|jgi:NAD(P)-dependent dehydrogenase (short-subunit alcohol dehydrogenase family)